MDAGAIRIGYTLAGAMHVFWALMIFVAGLAVIYFLLALTSEWRGRNREVVPILGCAGWENI